MVLAADCTDDDALECLRLRPVLVDRAAGALEVLLPEELYDLDLQTFVLNEH